MSAIRACLYCGFAFCKVATFRVVAIVADTLELAKNVFQRYTHENATIVNRMQLHILRNKISRYSGS
jgi:predicted nucleic acid binding AN1-type Zn finger protein